MDLRSGIFSYLDEMSSPHHRYRSWEHCYNYFNKPGCDRIRLDPERAALELGFYLASWGMYRGSSFLLQHAYTAHLGAVEVIGGPSFRNLWHYDFESRDDETSFVTTVTPISAMCRILSAETAKRMEASANRDTDTAGLLQKTVLAEDFT